MTSRGSFRPEEIEDEALSSDSIGPGPERADLLAGARDLEWLAAGSDVRPSAGFTDRVMATLADEPLPAPAIAVGSAVREGRLAAVAAAFGDFWRVAWSGKRPLAVRIQAIAIVLVVAVGVAAAGGGAILGAWNALNPLGPPVGASASPDETTSTSPEPSPEPTEQPSGSPETTPTNEPTTVPSATPSPRATQEAGGGSSATPKPTPKPTPTPEPTSTHTPEPSSDEHSGTPTSTSAP